MIGSYIKIFVAHLRKNLLISASIALSLFIGILSSIVIIYYVLFEESYDKSYKDGGQIYRIITENYKDNELTRTSACTPTPMSRAVESEIPEITKSARYAFSGNAEIYYKGKSLFEEDVYFAEPSFFEFFPFPLKIGEDYKVLSEPNNVFLSESFANKLFGDEDPLEKSFSIISFGKEHICKVKGVFKDLPENTYFKINAVISFANFYMKWGDNMDNNWVFHLVNTYVKINKNSDPADIEAKLETLAEKHMGDFFRKSDVYRKYKLQPIEDMYLHSDLLYEFGKNGDGDSVKYLAIISVILIIVSLINYINLQTSQAFKRSKEIGIRKTIGGTKVYVFEQFILESFLFGLFICLMALLFFMLFKSQVQMLVAKHIEIVSGFWMIFLCLILLTTVLPGLYLSFILSPVRSADVLKGKNKIAITKSFRILQKASLIFQFFASIVFIVFSFTINRQIKYMVNRDLGIDIDNTLIIQKPSNSSKETNFDGNYKVFLDRLSALSQIRNITESNYIPGQDIQNRLRFRKAGEDQTKEQYCSVGEIDSKYITNYKHKLIAGKKVPVRYYENKRQVILNEEAFNLFGFESPDDAIGKIIMRDEEEMEIIGIIKNYHQQSLKNSFMPTVFIVNDFPSSGFISIKYSNSKYSELVGSIKDIWSENFPFSPFQYFQLKDFFQEQYKSEFLLNKLIILLSIISVIITALGISGLAFSDIVNRTKEIGIRKVMGAGISQLIITFSKKYNFILLAAILTGIPLSYMIVKNWLDKFAFKIRFPWELILIAVITLIIILISIIAIYIIYITSFNPEKALREE